MLHSLKPRFSSNSEYGERYTDFIHDYDSLDHMSIAPTDKLKTKSNFYLPHHGVVRSSSSSTKLRVVFNASQKTRTSKQIPKL